MTSDDRASILVVEDDRPLLTAISEWLTSAGFDVRAASSFEAARAALDAGIPDLLLADIRLGAFNGLQLIIRAQAIGPRLRAIVMTGYPDPVILREAERLHVRHLEKPFTCDSLVHAIRASLAAPLSEIENDAGAHRDTM